MYYIYALIDIRTNLPFYIGKGKVSNKRHLDHFNESLENTTNRHKFYKIQSLISLGLEIPVEILKTGIENEEDAYALETKFIQQYGRINIDSDGILTNICLDNRPPNKTGLKQTSAHVRNRVASRKKTIMIRGNKKHSDETKKKISESVSGVKNGFYGKKHSEENKKKHSDRMKGNQNNIKQYEFISPSGQKIVTKGFYKFCNEHGLISSTMEKVLKTGNPTKKGKCKGWKVYKLSNKRKVL